ncbi:hypothetical protein RDWZM_001844 [Blomia tropicalis]|uniref:Histone H2A n=1 Tax=Blomia tropicalis TaxID=40697 RepID=A0A9Q0RQY8_BLOTA|nr:hypothetical protein BLOT_007973 [Blomia tropicalis]KAJ6223299.1 hypothetical protein RDWZM_001844 [Blomia tropicalis]
MSSTQSSASSNGTTTAATPTTTISLALSPEQSKTTTATTTSSSEPQSGSVQRHTQPQPRRRRRRMIRGKWIRLSRVRRYLRLHSRYRKISQRAVLLCTVMIEHCLETILIKAKEAAKDDRSTKIKNRHLTRAIIKDEMMRIIFNRSVIPNGGGMIRNS